ncbi:MAG: hypothetical protein WDW38_007076 [Sanguina aurantia]
MSGERSHSHARVTPLSRAATPTPLQWSKLSCHLPRHVRPHMLRIQSATPVHCTPPRKSSGHPLTAARRVPAHHTQRNAGGGLRRHPEGRRGLRTPPWLPCTGWHTHAARAPQRSGHRPGARACASPPAPRSHALPAAESAHTRATRATRSGAAPTSSRAIQRGAAACGGARSPTRASPLCISCLWISFNRSSITVWT